MAYFPSSLCGVSNKGFGRFRRNSLLSKINQLDSLKYGKLIWMVGIRKAYILKEHSVEISRKQ